MFLKISAVVIVFVAIAFGISQIGIKKIFNYPDILREDPDVILKKYHEAGGKLRAFWFLFVLGSLGLIPLSGVFYIIFNTQYLIIGSFFGIAAAIFYCIGLMRWVFLAKVLSEDYCEDNVDKNMIKTIFKCFNVYCGNSIGETMGFISLGISVLIEGIAVFQSGFVPAVIGIILSISGVGISCGPLEWVGVKSANKINKISLKVMAVCFVIIAVFLFVK